MINVVCVDISQVNTALYQRLYAAASPSRKARADRYHKREDAIRCVTADALIRFALTGSWNTKSSHTEVRLPAGKPYLEGRPDFHYSLSHSGKWVAIAWGSNPVGIDVEVFRSNSLSAEIARRHFTPEEQDFLFHLEESRQTEAFFQIWTAKESYVKYLGTGLSTNLASFCTLNPEALGVNFHRMQLDDASLCLCAAEPEYRLLIFAAKALFT